MVGKVCTIYKAYSKTSGKSYVGFDSHWPDRKRQHKYSAFTKNSDTHFHKAIRLYGWDDFEWEILYQSTDKKHTLTVMEPHFIVECGDYNIASGGEGTHGVLRTDEQKKHQSSVMKGNKYATGLVHTEEHKEKLRLMYSGEGNPLYGKKHSEETKKKIAEKAIGRKWDEKRKLQQSIALKNAWNKRKSA
jgi:group I intron endonuclease